MNTEETIKTTEVSEQTEVQVETQPQDTTKTFTQEDVDRIVTKRLEKESKKWEARFDALQESQKLQSMNEEQKAEYEYNKRLSDLEAREQAIAEREQAYNQATYKATIQAQLKEANLPDMSDLLINMDAEAVANQINIMKQSFTNQLNAQLEAKVQASANTPTQPSEQVKLLSLDEIKAMTPNEYMANKQLVEQSLKALSK